MIRIPNVLIIGNGINKSFGCQSWDELLDSISDKEMLSADKKIITDNLPYSLQAVALSKNTIGQRIKEIVPEMIRTELPEAQAKLIRQFADLEFDTVLTTNYTYEIERALDPSFSCKISTRNKYRKTLREDADKSERRLGMFKCMEVQYEGRPERIFHIHGEAGLPDSIVLGHYYYGELLSKCYKRLPSVIAEYKKCDKEALELNYNSWLKYILIGNVYIIGLGLDPAELDLWWLLNCKQYRFPNAGKVYWYEPNLEKDEKAQVKKILAETYGVNVITRRINSNYQKYYKETAEEIKNTLQIE